jgi:hypothetical protein
MGLIAAGNADQLTHLEFSRVHHVELIIFEKSLCLFSKFPNLTKITFHHCQFLNMPRLNFDSKKYNSQEEKTVVGKCPQVRQLDFISCVFSGYDYFRENFLKRVFELFPEIQEIDARQIWFMNSGTASV